MLQYSLGFPPSGSGLSTCLWAKVVDWVEESRMCEAARWCPHGATPKMVSAPATQNDSVGDLAVGASGSLHTPRESEPRFAT